MTDTNLTKQVNKFVILFIISIGQSMTNKNWKTKLGIQRCKV